MGEWCTEHHNKSGLVDRCKNSSYSPSQAERIVLNFVAQHVVQGSGILAGNSVYMDKMFIQKDMPHLHAYLNYRIVDVSSVKEMCRRWYPEEFKNAPKKKMMHTAMSDVKESIEEMRYYRQTIFK